MMRKDSIKLFAAVILLLTLALLVDDRTRSELDLFCRIGATGALDLFNEVRTGLGGIRDSALKPFLI